MEGYKITCEVNGKYYSFAYDPTERYLILGACLEYKEDEWTTRFPDCGPLAVFDAFDDVEDFLTRECDFTEVDVDYRHHAVVWECEYEPSDDLYLWIPNVEDKHYLPCGTKLAEKVKLVNKIADFYS